MMKGVKIVLIIGFVIALLFATNHFLLKNHDEIFGFHSVEHKRSNNGLYKEYYENGILKTEESYSDGDKVGVWKNYYNNGSIKSISIYEKGKLNGVVSHFDSCETLIYNEYFKKGKLTRTEITNDSLYRFEVIALPYGKELFSKKCETCHESKTEKLLGLIQPDTNTLISPDLACIELDSIHAYLFDSLYVDEDAWFFEKKEEALNEYDIHSLKIFLDQLSKKQNTLPKNPKKHQIKGKTS